MVAFHVGIMGHVRRNSYTSCTRPQGASKFQTAKCTVPMGVGCEFSSHTSRGVRTSRLCQMVAFHVGIMGHVRRNSYTSCTRPQGASKFQTAQCTVPMGVGCEFKFSYFPGCTNKPFVPDGSLPCGNHGTCQTQVVHLLYEATGSLKFQTAKCTVPMDRM